MASTKPRPDIAFIGGSDSDESPLVVPRTHTKRRTLALTESPCDENSPTDAVASDLQKRFNGPEDFRSPLVAIDNAGLSLLSALPSSLLGSSKSLAAAQNPQPPPSWDADVTQTDSTCTGIHTLLKELTLVGTDLGMLPVSAAATVPSSMGGQGDCSCHGSHPGSAQQAVTTHTIAASPPKAWSPAYGSIPLVPTSPPYLPSSAASPTSPSYTPARASGASTSARLPLLNEHQNGSPSNAPPLAPFISSPPTAVAATFQQQQQQQCSPPTTSSDLLLPPNTDYATPEQQQQAGALVAPFSTSPESAATGSFQQQLQQYRPHTSSSAILSPPLADQATPEQQQQQQQRQHHQQQQQQQAVQPFSSPPAAPPTNQSRLSLLDAYTPWLKTCQKGDASLSPVSSMSGSLSFGRVGNRLEFSSPASFSSWPKGISSAGRTAGAAEGKENTSRPSCSREAPPPVGREHSGRCGRGASGAEVGVQTSSSSSSRRHQCAGADRGFEVSMSLSSGDADSRGTETKQVGSSSSCGISRGKGDSGRGKTGGDKGGSSSRSGSSSSGSSGNRQGRGSSRGRSKGKGSAVVSMGGGPGRDVSPRVTPGVGVMGDKGHTIVSSDDEEDAPLTFGKSLVGQRAALLLASSESETEGVARGTWRRPATTGGKGRRGRRVLSSSESESGAEGVVQPRGAMTVATKRWGRNLISDSSEDEGKGGSPTRGRRGEVAKRVETGARPSGARGRRKPSSDETQRQGTGGKSMGLCEELLSRVYGGGQGKPSTGGLGISLSISSSSSGAGGSPSDDLKGSSSRSSSRSRGRSSSQSWLVDVGSDADSGSSSSSRGGKSFTSKPPVKGANTTSKGMRKDGASKGAEGKKGNGLQKQLSQQGGLQDTNRTGKGSGDGLQLTPQPSLLPGNGPGGSAVGRGQKGVGTKGGKGGYAGGAARPDRDVKTMERSLAAAKRVATQKTRDFAKQRQQIAAGLYAEWNALVRAGSCVGEGKEQLCLWPSLLAVPSVSAGW